LREGNLMGQGQWPVSRKVTVRYAKWQAENGYE